MAKKPYTFIFGTTPGTYPPGCCLTDSIFKRKKKTVSHFILDDITVNIDAAQRHDKTLGCLDLTGLATVASGSTLTVVFQ